MLATNPDRACYAARNTSMGGALIAPRAAMKPQTQTRNTPPNTPAPPQRCAETVFQIEQLDGNHGSENRCAGSGEQAGGEAECRELCQDAGQYCAAANSQCAQHGALEAAFVNGGLNGCE